MSNGWSMSALPPKADIPRGSWNVRFGPIADQVQCSKRIVIRSPQRHGGAAPHPDERRNSLATFVCSGIKFVPSCAGLGAITSLVLGHVFEVLRHATEFQLERTMTVISVIVGSMRQGRFSEKPAQWIFQQ